MVRRRPSLVSAAVLYLSLALGAVGCAAAPDDESRAESNEAKLSQNIEERPWSFEIRRAQMDKYYFGVGRDGTVVQIVLRTPSGTARSLHYLGSSEGLLPPHETDHLDLEETLIPGILEKPFAKYVLDFDQIADNLAEIQYFGNGLGATDHLIAKCNFSLDRDLLIRTGQAWESGERRLIRRKQADGSMWCDPGKAGLLEIDFEIRPKPCGPFGCDSPKTNDK